MSSQYQVSSRHRARCYTLDSRTIGDAASAGVETTLEFKPGGARSFFLIASAASITHGTVNIKFSQSLSGVSTGEDVPASPPLKSGSLVYARAHSMPGDELTVKYQIAVTGGSVSITGLKIDVHFFD